MLQTDGGATWGPLQVLYSNSSEVHCHSLVLEGNILKITFTNINKCDQSVKNVIGNAAPVQVS